MITSSCLDTQVVLLNLRSGATQSVRYARIAFEVPARTVRLTLTVTQNSRRHAQIPVALFDSQGNVRIMKASDGTVGFDERIFTLSSEAASEGCTPGSLPAGTWKLILYKRRMLEDVKVRAEALADVAETDSVFAKVNPPEAETLRKLKGNPFSGACLDPAPGWYCGELHVHSKESTGQTDVKAIRDAARAQELDFIAVTDHFTASHWLKLQAVDTKEKPLFLQSMEISGDMGHANAHGLRNWLNPLVDDNIELSAFLDLPTRPSMEWIADRVHLEGGLMCINHALSGIFGWRYRDFPMEKADLFEVICLPEAETSFLYSTQWEHYLASGLHLTGVGSSDSHHPTKEGPWKLGQVRTWVYAQSLSQRALLDGLKKGHAYVAWGRSRMRFWATCAGRTAQMGDTLCVCPGEKATFHLTMLDHPEGNLFILSDALLVDTIPYPEAEETAVTWEMAYDEIKAEGESYVRLEYHEALSPTLFYGMAFRNHLSPRLIANPVWLKRETERSTP